MFYFTFVGLEVAADSCNEVMASCDVDPHNFTVLTTLKIGDLVEFPRGLYSHWGVYIGNQEIVHMTSTGNSGSEDSFTSCCLFSNGGENLEKACVKIDDFFQVARGCKAKRNNDKDEKCSPLNPEEIVRRAKAMVGPIEYNLILNNCEHVAAYLRYDVKWSGQGYKAAGKAITLLANKLFGGSNDKK